MIDPADPLPLPLVPAARRSMLLTDGRKPRFRRNGMRKASGILIAAIGRVVRNDGILFAGHMAFMAMLSFFPFLVFLTALAGFIGEPQSAEAFI